MAIRLTLAAMASAALAFGGPVCAAIAPASMAPAASVMSAPAAPPTQFALFAEFCAGHQGDFPGLVAALKARNFARSDAEVTSSGESGETASYGTQIAGVDYLIALATIPPSGPKQPRPLVLCAVMQSGADPLSLEAARAWIGLPLSGKPTGQELYIYRQTATGRVRIADMDSPEAEAAMLADEYRQVNLVIQATGTGLVLVSQ